MFRIGPIPNSPNNKWKKHWRSAVTARCITIDVKAEKDRIIEQRITRQVLKSIKLLIKYQRDEKIRRIINDVFAAHNI